MYVHIGTMNDVHNHYTTNIHPIEPPLINIPSFRSENEYKTLEGTTFRHEVWMVNACTTHSVVDGNVSRHREGEFSGM